jgi:predicted secreted hydrolase
MVDTPPRVLGRARLLLCIVLLASVLLSGCGTGREVQGYVIGNTREETKPTLPPISLPDDEAPHDDLTEWWYYTGHLFAGEKRYGFELVTFQAVRGDLPRSYVAHFAITDLDRGTFRYDQKTYTGPQPALAEGFDLRVGGWEMRGLNGRDRLRAATPGYAIDLALRAEKPVVLHEGDGIISFGPAGDSYYYSRTRMSVRGTIDDHGRRLPVTGQAWMDHQWGNFISVAGGGWDWYSVQLEDGADLTISVVRNLEGEVILEYGTYVEPDGTAGTLSAEQIDIAATARWRSPRTGAVYPARWRVSIPDKNLRLDIVPPVADQELDTRKTTGVAYWEGAVDVSGTRDMEPVRGMGYVELTGYAPSAPESTGHND